MSKAEEIWSSIPSETREKLIHNVFCSSCIDVTTIVDYTIEKAELNNDIVLEGKCKKCSDAVARYIEQ